MLDKISIEQNFPRINQDNSSEIFSKSFAIMMNKYQIDVALKSNCCLATIYKNINNFNKKQNAR
jgi:hypothetical protein